MKKYTFYKTVQLVLFILLTLIALLQIFPNEGVYHLIAQDVSARALAMVLWVAFGLSFVFIYFDFSFFFGYRKEYREMDLAVHSDPISGIANRFSCDMIVEKYLEHDLPMDLGCVMIDITNIRDINRLYGHVAGNNAIGEFSSILRLSSLDLCFVGRNGGNKFLCVFESCSEEKLTKFLDRVRQRVALHNRDEESAPLAYRYGVAVAGEETLSDITELISLSNRRISEPAPENRTGGLEEEHLAPAPAPAE
ncbi:MAG: GGDEF domain-containing protein [Clostridia bacterium]|nr:GGDEF domain-containing protein [Clostridia bacterium]